MNNVKPVLGLLFIALAFWSCRASIVEVDLPEHEPRLVVTAPLGDPFFNPLQYIYLTSSNSPQSISSPLTLNDLEDGSYQLIRNGSPVDSFRFYNSIDFFSTDDSSINGIRLYKDFFNDYGDRYKLIIRIKNFLEIILDQTMPYPPEYEALSFDSIPKIDSKFTPYFTTHLSFKDEPNQEDFYHIQAYIIKRNNPAEKYSIWTWSTEDKLGLESYYDNSLVLNDEDFNGLVQSIELRIDSRFIHPEDDILVLNFARMTEDSYRFHRSFRQHILSQETPFSEPITTYSNIENGFGIFGLEASTLITIRP